MPSGDRTHKTFFGSRRSPHSLQAQLSDEKSKDIVLKFDIEGGEWELFKTQFVDSLLPLDALGDASAAERPRLLTAEEKAKAKPYLPQALLFEAHSKYCNPAYVPPALVKHATRSKINQLFRALHLLGYRLLRKDVNGGDPAASEFSMILVD